MCSRTPTENKNGEEIVGSSVALRKVFAQVAKVAPVDSTVLILGEAGTGKELIARAIHKRSKRSSRAFYSRQLRGDSAIADRIRTVRPREGRIHRRAATAFGAL